MIIKYSGVEYILFDEFVNFFKEKFWYDGTNIISPNLISNYFNNNIPTNEKIIIIYDYQFDVLETMVSEYNDTRYLPNWVICEKNKKLDSEYSTGRYITKKYFEQSKQFI